MNDKMVFGQYIYRNSLTHKIDARTKLFILVCLMIGVFLIPKDNFILLALALIVPLIGVIFSKISFFKYLSSLKQIIFVVLFSFAFQVFITQNGELLLTSNVEFSILNCSIILVVWILYFVFRKYLKFRLLICLFLLAGCVYLLRYPIYGNVFYQTKIFVYSDGLIHGGFIVARVFVVILASTTLTLTTKPTDLTNAIEWYLKPLELVKIKTSVFAMMISIALRSIPTLFNETNRILKAQASRGADFSEGKLSEQVKQIISLLIPMFVISIKRAEDLADAMEVRGYVPGAKRTRLTVMKFSAIDYLSCIVVISLFVFIILCRCGVCVIN